MTERVWEKFLTPRDLEVFRETGMGQLGGFGERPALVVVDVNYNFAGDKEEPILEAIKRWPTACGESSWPAIRIIRGLLDTAHASNVPVIYSTSADGRDFAGWSRKMSRYAEDVDRLIRGRQIVAEIAPAENDLVIKKRRASIFHGTDILDYLVRTKIDTLIFTGASTSGCVRASVTDAASYGLLCGVVEDGCFDRSEASHAVSLCDLHMKYADVLPSSEIHAYLKKTGHRGTETQR